MPIQLAELPEGVFFQTVGGRVTSDGQGWFTLIIDAPDIVAQVHALLTQNDWEIQGE